MLFAYKRGLDKQIGKLNREYILPLRYVPVPTSPPIDVDTEFDPSELKHKYYVCIKNKSIVQFISTAFLGFQVKLRVISIVVIINSTRNIICYVGT